MDDSETRRSIQWMPLSSDPDHSDRDDFKSDGRYGAEQPDERSEDLGVELP